MPSLRLLVFLLAAGFSDRSFGGAARGGPGLQPTRKVREKIEASPAQQRKEAKGAPPAAAPK